MHTSLARLLLSLLLLLDLQSAAAESIILQPVIPGLEMGRVVEILEDKDGSLDLDAVRGVKAQDFRLSEQQHPNFGFTRSAFWVRFQIHNPSGKSAPLYLEYGYPSTNFVNFYFPDEQGSYQSKRSGDRVPYATRDIPYRLPVFVFDVPPGAQTYYLRVETDGVNQIPLRLWTPAEFHNKRTAETGFLSLIYGFFVVMFFYNVFLGVAFRNISYLYYIGFILLSIANHFGYQGLYLVFLPAESAIWFANEGFIMITGLLVFSACTFSLSFLNINRVSRPVKWLLLTEAGLGLLVLPIAPFSYNLAVKIAVANAFLASIVVLTASVIACIKRYRPAYFFTLAWFLTIVGNLANPLALAGVIPINLFTNWSHFIGIAVEVVLISLALGDKMRLAQERSEQKVRQMNEKLEDMVEEKTRDIKSILTNIKLGIFAILPEKYTVHRDYSSHLKELFKGRNIEESHALDLLLNDSNISPDQRSQIKAALDASFGEDEMAFQMNEGVFPSEIHYQKGNSARFLEVDWSPMLTRSRKIERVLVTCKDVTETRLYKRAAEEQQKELEYIGELINVTQEMFSKFSSATHRFLAENMELIQKADELRPDIVRILFINMHTIKGAARSLGFRELTQAVHLAEETLSMIQKGDLKPDRAQLLQELANVEKALNYYEWVNSKKLNRTLHLPDTVEIRIDDLERKLLFIEDMEKLRDLRSLAQSITQLKHRLAPLVFRSAEEVITELCESLPKLAKDLGKECPELKIEARHIYLTHACTDMLRHIFVHILRNALDHGIESGPERKQAGKSERGLIAVQLRAEPSGSLQVLIQDDGRGLALQLIEQVARIRGLVSNHTQLSAEEVAQFIFESGFSTSAGVSEISGRGVGMEAVRRLLQEHGAKIRLVLNQEPQDVKTFAAFHFEITLPAHLFRILNPAAELALVG